MIHDQHMGKKTSVVENNDYKSRSGDDYHNDKNGSFYEYYEYSGSGNYGIRIILVPKIAINDNPSTGDCGIQP